MPNAYGKLGLRDEKRWNEIASDYNGTVPLRAFYLLFTHAQFINKAKLVRLLLAVDCFSHIHYAPLKVKKIWRWLLMHVDVWFISAKLFQQSFPIIHPERNENAEVK